MKILVTYLRRYWPLCLLALVLATINQVFSLLDPQILRLLVDNYANKTPQYLKTSVFTEAQYITGIMGLIGLGIAFAMVSRIAKNFQDYYINVITQKLGARIYQD